MITTEEKKFIKAYKAIPESLIEKKVKQLKDDLIFSEGENFQSSQLFVRELLRWLATIKIYKEGIKIKKQTKQFEK